MPVLIVDTEKNFAALRARLFSGRVSTAAARAVAEAVRAANPHADLDALQPGTVLTIPDAPRLAIEGELSLDEATRRRIEELTAGATAALDELVTVAGGREREGAAERKRLAKLLDAREVEAAAGEDSALAADVEATRSAVAEEERRAKERAAALKQAHSDWTAELKALERHLS